MNDEFYKFLVNFSTKLVECQAIVSQAIGILDSERDNILDKRASLCFVPINEKKEININEKK